MQNNSKSCPKSSYLTASVNSICHSLGVIEIYKAISNILFPRSHITDRKIKLVFLFVVNEYMAYVYKKFVAAFITYVQTPSLTSVKFILLLAFFIFQVQCSTIIIDAI